MTAMEVGNYLAEKYKKAHGKEIEEQVLHDLLYLSQKEYILKTGKVLFNDLFTGHRDGPVIELIHKIFPYFSSSVKRIEDPSITKVLDKVYKDYGERDAKSLYSSVTDEISWKNSRKGIAEHEESCNEIKVEDIFKDVQRKREKINSLRMLGLYKE